MPTESVTAHPLISIIVPVYGAEAQLPRCLDSLLKQDYPALEIILVEDGSPDACAAICDRYAAADPRIRVCHQPNAGASAARNKGMELATGEYLCFVDADDEVEPHYVRAFAEGLGPEVDMVFQGICELHDEREVRLIPEQKLYTAAELTEGIADLNLKHMFLFGYVCTKLYRRSIIREHGLTFRRDISLSEDRIFALSYMRYVRCMQTVAVCAYNYRILSTGLTLRSRSYEELKTAADANLHAAQELLHLCPSDRFERDTQLTYISSAFSYLQALFLRPYTLAARVHALRTFRAEAGAWLPLLRPTTNDMRIMALALRRAPFIGVCLLDLYWSVKKLKHRVLR